MTSIPLSADDVHPFVPPSLVNVVPTPTFRFRAPTERDIKRYHHILTTEGVRHFPQEAIRAEMFATLQRNWSPDVYEKEKAKLDNVFARIDQKLEVKPEEQTALSELMMRCMDVSPLLRRMDADNRRFAEEAPITAIAMYVVGWSNVPTPFRMEGGIIPGPTIDRLARDLRDIEAQAMKDKVEGVVVPGMAFIELTTHAFQQMVVDEDTEKNSDAPSPSSDTPNGSKTSSRRDGASKAAKARSSSKRSKTRATRSPATAAS